MVGILSWVPVMVQQKWNLKSYVIRSIGYIWRVVYCLLRRWEDFWRLMISKLVLLLIRIYQLVVSPYLTSQCRYNPTCSRYSSEAISRHGMVEGSRLAIVRLARCTPWGGQGFDPVPWFTQPTGWSTSDHVHTSSPGALEKYLKWILGCFQNISYLWWG